MAQGYQKSQKARRLIILLIVAIVSLSFAAYKLTTQPKTIPTQPTPVAAGDSAMATLTTLEVKGRAPKTGYARTQFTNGWLKRGECDVRNIILRRDLENVQVDDVCHVLSGTLRDPYTGKDIQFLRGANSSAKIQIDHVVALGNAWQTGAQQLDTTRRLALANDPLNLLAVDGAANQEKSDGDAATWLPPNKVFRCQYVARQIAVKHAYALWVTQAEHDAMMDTLATCPNQALPTA